MAIRRPSLAYVARATHFALLDIQMANTASCLAAAEHKQMIQDARGVLTISLPVNLLQRQVRLQQRT